MTIALKSRAGARSGKDSKGREGSAPLPDFRYLRRATRDALARSSVARAIVIALRDGATSAATSDACGLTYADGWHAAATLAQLAAFDALKLPDA